MRIGGATIVVLAAAALVIIRPWETLAPPASAAPTSAPDAGTPVDAAVPEPVRWVLSIDGSTSDVHELADPRSLAPLTDTVRDVARAIPGVLVSDGSDAAPADVPRVELQPNLGALRYEAGVLRAEVSFIVLRDGHTRSMLTGSALAEHDDVLATIADPTPSQIDAWLASHPELVAQAATLPPIAAPTVRARELAIDDIRRARAEIRAELIARATRTALLALPRALSGIAP